MVVSFTHFQPHMAPSLASCWNRAFAEKRSFTAISAADFQARVLDQRAFDPRGLIVALAGSGGRGSATPSSRAEVVGFVHAFRPLRAYGGTALSHSTDAGRESMPFVYRAQRCWDQACVAALAVAPEWRGQGIGTWLLAEGEAYLRAHPSSVDVAVGDLHVPLYHTLEGPRQPFWGDSEAMGISEGDSRLVGFFLGRGYRRIKRLGQEITMLATVGPRSRPTQPPLEQRGLRALRVSESSPWDGPIAWYPPDAPSGYAHHLFGAYQHQALALARDDTITSQVEWYPMRQPGRVALFDIQVAPDDRGQGLGTYLLDEFLWLASESGYREVELHTQTDKYALAYEMYQRRGFRIVESWVTLARSVGAA